MKEKGRRKKFQQQQTRKIKTKREKFFFLQFTAGKQKGKRKEGKKVVKMCQLNNFIIYQEWRSGRKKFIQGFSLFFIEVPTQKKESF